MVSTLNGEVREEGYFSLIPDLQEHAREFNIRESKQKISVGSFEAKDVEIKTILSSSAVGHP